MTEQQELPEAAVAEVEGQDTVSQRLSERAILFLGGPITDEDQGLVAALLDYHYREDFNEPITLIINSPGGYCHVGWQIIDTMNFIRLPVHTVCMGVCASMAADIFVNGDHRTMGEHSCLMIHPHLAYRFGSHSNLLANRKSDDMEHKRRIAHYLNNSKYLSVKAVEETLFETKGDDLWLSPQEALEHGLTEQVAVSDKAKRRKSFGFVQGKIKKAKKPSGKSKPGASDRKKR